MPLWDRLEDVEPLRIAYFRGCGAPAYCLFQRMRSPCVLPISEDAEHPRIA